MTRPCQHAVYPRCGCDVGYAPTLRPPLDRVAAYLASRRAIDALWREADALWDNAVESEHDAMVTGLGDDWRPRR